jgi:hypothetical protein
MRACSDVREAMADAAQSTGRHPPARTGAEALALLAEPSFPRPGLVPLDWTMSSMSGAELAAIAFFTYVSTCPTVTTTFPLTCPSPT